jgi:adenylate cyclase
MGIEIEKKYLLENSNWKTEAFKTIKIKQGYLNSEIERTIRVRTSGNEGIITIKGKTVNLTRSEFEYAIPLNDALELLKMCDSPIIEKTRYLIKKGELTWEIDEFSGENEGLIVAEIELTDENQEFDLPEWIGKEVSHDTRYYNSSLISNPYKNWLA